MKYIVLAVLPLLLSACAIPAAVVATAAADGVTFLSSGKSITSHTLTAATEKDCSVLFGITRGEFCKEKDKSDDYSRRDAGFVVPKDSPAVPEEVATPAAASKSTKVQELLEPRFYDFDHETPPAPVAKAQPAVEAKPASAANGVAANRTQWTLVLGTFADHRRAIDLARRVKPEPGLVTTTIVRGEVQYQVSTRPLSRDRDVGRTLNFKDLKLESVKLMPVCPVGVQNDKCIALDQSLDVQHATLPHSAAD